MLPILRPPVPNGETHRRPIDLRSVDHPGPPRYRVTMPHRFIEERGPGPQTAWPTWDPPDVRNALDRHLAEVDAACRSIEGLAAVGVAGDGLVTVVVEGTGRIRNLMIDPDFHEQYDAESVAAFVEAAVGDGHDRLASVIHESTTLPSVELEADLPRDSGW
jgi:DNA-binding protein YbaB